MTIKQLIEGVVKTNGESPDWESISSTFDIFDLYWSEDKRLLGYPIQTWLCTDTLVGMTAFFLDDEFVFLTKKSCRKCHTKYIFKSKESYIKVNEYLKSLREDERESEFELIDMEYSYGDSYIIEYPTQLLPSFHKIALYKEEEVTVVKVTRGYNSNNVMIEFNNAKREVVDIKELRFFYNKRYSHQFENLEYSDIRDLKLSKILEE